MLAHLRLLHKQTVRCLAGHGQCVIGLVSLLGACAQDAQQLWEGFTGFRKKNKKNHIARFTNVINVFQVLFKQAGAFLFPNEKKVLKQ